MNNITIKNFKNLLKTGASKFEDIREIYTPDMENVLWKNPKFEG